MIFRSCAPSSYQVIAFYFCSWVSTEYLPMVNSVLSVISHLRWVTSCTRPPLTSTLRAVKRPLLQVRYFFTHEKIYKIWLLQREQSKDSGFRLTQRNCRLPRVTVTTTLIILQRAARAPFSDRGPCSRVRITQNSSNIETCHGGFPLRGDARARESIVCRCHWNRRLGASVTMQPRI